jgi:drug/metabolite transporter (DMT)-like permease
MEPLSRPRAHALLHFTVLLWGTTAILGKSIHIAALPLVFYRVAIVTLLMAAVLVRRRVPFAVSWKRAAELGGAGVLVALHWVLFYAAVKLAGVSLAVLCLSTITFFTALLEPLVFRRPVKRHELVLGALVVIGVVLLLRLEGHGSSLGIVMGMASAFFSAAFGTWNGSLVLRERAERALTWNGSLVLRERAERVTLYELAAAGIACGVAFVFLGGFVPPWEVSRADWALLAFLAVACTLLPWLWSLRVLKTLSPYTVAISVSLEPVYSIVFAYLLWPTEERLTTRFYVGVGLLIALVVVNGALKNRSSAVP